MKPEVALASTDIIFSFKSSGVTKEPPPTPHRAAIVPEGKPNTADNNSASGNKTLWYSRNSTGGERMARWVLAGAVVVSAVPGVIIAVVAAQVSCRSAAAVQLLDTVQRRHEPIASPTRLTRRWFEWANWNSCGLKL